MERLKKTFGQMLGTQRELFTVSPGTSVLDALRLMADKNVHALLVMEAGRLIGLFSEHDYARQGELQGRVARDTPVSELMVRDPATVAPEDTVERCLALIKSHEARYWPVLAGGQVLGVLSSRDVLEEMIREEEHLIRDIERERLTLLHPDPSSY